MEQILTEFHNLNLSVDFLLGARYFEGIFYMKILNYSICTKLFLSFQGDLVSWHYFIQVKFSKQYIMFMVLETLSSMFRTNMYTQIPWFTEDSFILPLSWVECFYTFFFLLHLFNSDKSFCQYIILIEPHCFDGLRLI